MLGTSLLRPESVPEIAKSESTAERLDYGGITAELRPASLLEALESDEVCNRVPESATECERAVVSLFGGRIGTPVHSERLIEQLLAAGHAKSTVGRTLARLKRHKVILVQPGGLVYTGSPIPPHRVNIARPNDPTANNRFGAMQPLSQQAKLVQGVLIERLEEAFEDPSSFLARVLLLIVAMDHYTRACESGSSLELEKWEPIIRGLKKELTGSPTGQLHQNHLFSALEIAFFPSEFLDDPEICAEIKKDFERRNRVSEELICDAVVHSQWVAEENQRIEAENEARKRRGEPPLELVENRPVVGDRPKWEGLVPPNGGGRVGELRSRAFAQRFSRAVGADETVDT